MTSCLRDIRLVDGPVGIEAMTPFPPTCGAECVFVGRTRAETHSRYGPLESLVYHAYESMASSVLHRLCDAAIQVYGLRAVRLLHATGVVPVGAASVVVQVAAGHRDCAFVACRTLIDRLKVEAPIWKRERWAHGATWAPGVMPETPHASDSKRPTRKSAE